MTRVLFAAFVLAALFAGMGCKGDGDNGADHADKQDRLDTVSGKPHTD